MIDNARNSDLLAVWIDGDATRIDQMFVDDRGTNGWVVQWGHFDGVFRRIGPVEATWDPIDRYTLRRENICTRWNNNKTKTMKKCSLVHGHMEQSEITIFDEHLLIGAIVVGTEYLLWRNIAPVYTAAWTIFVHTNHHLPTQA